MIMPFTYALATNDYGAAEVHKYVGTEPSGNKCNHLSLDDHRASRARARALSSAQASHTTRL